MVVKTKYFMFDFDETKGYYARISLYKLAWFTSLLPFSGFVFCVIWSLIYNFEETTYTHCKVWNYLPSISAAIGNHMTQYIVWCTVITLHAPSRFLFAAINHQFYLKEVKHHKRWLANVAYYLNIIENLALLGLTYLTSSGAYVFHEKFFITFVITSELYMIITCFILKYARKSTSYDPLLIFSVKIKVRLVIINAVSFLTAGYFFLRHNEYCEPGIYTLFAFFEYVVVMSNIAFHLTALLDIKQENIIIYKNGIDVS